jgi:hypothetical protein
MLKLRISFFLIILLGFLSANGVRHKTAGDSLVSIIKLPDDELRDRKMVDYLYSRYLYSSSFDGAISALYDTVHKYDEAQESEYENFALALINRRSFKFNNAERYLLKAISAAQKADHMFLLFTFYSNMGFLKTDNGEPLAALQSYQVAHKVADDLNDPKLVATTDINMSDLYSKIQLYTQALHYLDHADNFCKLYPNTAGAMTCANIDINKAEIYFKLGNKDSLRYYAKRTDVTDNQLYDIQRIRSRLHYYIYLLDKDYPKAIDIIKNVLLEKKYDRNVDRWNLADSYYKLNKLDSAELTAQDIISEDELKSPQIRYQSYKLLSQISQKKGDYKTAAYQNGLALNELESFLKSMVHVGDLSSQMQLDQLESSYLVQTLNYKKENTLLIFTIMLVVLLVIVVAMFYFNISQKLKYENIINANKTQELAFLNSHGLRKHLANILGICDILIQDEKEGSELAKHYEYLSISAQKLDDAIKTMEKKLSEK